MRPHVQNAQSLKQPERAKRIGVCGVFRGFEAHLHMALRGEVIDLVRPDRLAEPDKICRIGHVAVMQEKGSLLLVRVHIESVDPAGVERGGAPLDPMHLVALCEQKPCEIGAVLPRNACNKGGLLGHKCFLTRF